VRRTIEDGDSVEMLSPTSSGSRSRMKGRAGLEPQGLETHAILTSVNPMAARPFKSCRPGAGELVVHILLIKNLENCIGRLEEEASTLSFSN
jgi:hypothetical protein